jgi:isopenicillin-N epimerase
VQEDKWNVKTLKREEEEQFAEKEPEVRFEMSENGGRHVPNRELRFPKASPFRKYWGLAPKTVFLNHGSFGACPKAVLAAQTEFRRQMEAEPIEFLWRRYEEPLDRARKALAKFVGARATDLVFVPNATTAVNGVVRSLELRPGDELLTTTQDYNACRNVLVEAARRAGAKMVLADVPFPVRTPDDIVGAIMREVTRKTRLAMVDHVSSHTALIFPIERIIRELEARGVETLVDGAHAPGMVPLDIRRLNPAYYTGNLHKWVCAPKGAAFLWAREDKQKGLQPAVISHGNNQLRPGYSRFQDRFDWAGTMDPSAKFSVADAIGWMGKLLPGGWRELRQRNHELAVKARRILCEQLGTEPLCPERMLGSMATLRLPERFQGRPLKGRFEEEQVGLYRDYGIEVPFLRIGKPTERYIRVSAELYNTAEEYEYLAEALARIE